MGMDCGSRLKDAAIIANYLFVIKKKSLLLSALEDFPVHLVVLHDFLLTSVLFSELKRWKPVAQKYCDPAASRPKECT